MMAQATTLITTAVTTEAEGIARRLGLRRDCRVCPGVPARSGGGDVVAVLGMGRERAGRLAAELLDRLKPERLVIAGFAGGLDPALRFGDAVVPGELLEAATGERFTPEWPEKRGGVVMVTSDELADTPERKAAMRQRYGAAAVDMESTAIAREARRRGVAWTGVRVVSDPYDVALPGFLLKLSRADGRPDFVAAAGHVLGHPGDLRMLLRMGRDFGRAGERLGEAVMSVMARES